MIVPSAGAMRIASVARSRSSGCMSSVSDRIGFGPTKSDAG
jgi:hypothetical protein